MSMTKNNRTSKNRSPLTYWFVQWVDIGFRIKAYREIKNKNENKIIQKTKDLEY